MCNPLWPCLHATQENAIARQRQQRATSKSVSELRTKEPRLESRAGTLRSHAVAKSALANSNRVTAFGVVLICTILLAPLAVAHDSWINRGGYRNSVGEWCCGENDCELSDQIATTGKGWVVGGTEFIPFEEATPSPDGKIWICRRPDHTRRCVFGPPPGS
jgi:hypothetical protein